MHVSVCVNSVCVCVCVCVSIVCVHKKQNNNKTYYNKGLLDIRLNYLR